VAAPARRRRQPRAGPRCAARRRSLGARECRRKQRL